MTLPPIPDEWRTNWHLAGHVDQLGDDATMDVTVAGISLEVSNEPSGLVARAGDRQFPVMVVDDEIFILLSDVPD